MRKQYIRKPRQVKPFQYRGTYTDWNVRYFEEQRRLNPNHDRFANIVSLSFMLFLYILFLWAKLQ